MNKPAKVRSTHTHINMYIRLAKSHTIEAHSDLQMLARDLRFLADSDEGPYKTDSSEGPVKKFDRDKLLELIGNINGMACDLAFLNTEINDRVGTRRWPDVQITPEKVKEKE